MDNQKKIVIGLVGETGSGKDTVAHYLKRKYGVRLLRFSQPLKKALKLFFDMPSKADQAWLYQMFKERFGEKVLHLGIKRFIEQHDKGIICINGLRMPEDIKLVRSFSPNYVIYVTADQKLRWQRTISRGEKEDDMQSFEDFKKFEATSETERAVPDIGRQADFTVHNDGTLDELLAEVNKAMDEIISR